MANTLPPSPQQPKKAPPPPPEQKSETPSSKENIQAKMEQARQASPSGTLGGSATGVSGVKGSQQATGGGTTRITASGSGKEGYTYSTVDVSKGEQKAIEQARQEAVKEQQAKQVEAMKQSVQQKYTGVERPAESAAQLAVLASGRLNTKFGQLVEQRRQELIAKAGPEAKTAHYVQYRAPDETKVEQTPQGTVTTTTKGGVFAVGVPGETKDLNKENIISNKDVNRTIGGTGNSIRNDISNNILFNQISNKETKGFFEQRLENLEQSKQNLGKDYKGIKAVQISTALVATSFLYTGGKILSNPVEFVKGVVSFLATPIKLFTPTGRAEIVTEGKQLFTNIVETPEVTIGSFGAQAIALKAAEPIVKPFINKPIEYVTEKVHPSFKPIESTNIQVVEGVTIPTQLNVLKSFEGKTVPTVHTTFAKISPGTTIEPQVAGASGWRANVGQFNFYTSSPKIVTLTKIVENKEIPVSYEGTPIAPRYKPVLYGGYIGIGEGYSAESKIAFSLLPKTPKALIFRETEIIATPGSVSRLPLREVVKFQTIHLEDFRQSLLMVLLVFLPMS